HRDVAFPDVRANVFRRPTHERIDFDQPEPAVPPHNGSVSAIGGLVAPNRADPGVEGHQHTAQWSRLTELAAAVRIPDPQVGSFETGLFIDGMLGPYSANREPIACLDLLPEGVGLWKKQARIEREEVDRE